MKSEIIVGTRGSELALKQTNIVIEQLKSFHSNLNIDIKVIKTTGDKILDKNLNKIGGKGLFIKELEEALINGEIDFAVHSMKDVPHTIPEDFCIAAVLTRNDPEDVIICKDKYDLAGLPAGSSIGTGSLRRMLQLKKIRPDLEFLPVRGNINTRINKLIQGNFDAIVLAAAGLRRMGWQKKDDSAFLQVLSGKNTETEFNISYLDVKDCIPAVGQGALAIETRKNDQDIIDIVRVLNDENTEKCTLAERTFLRIADGGCEVPIGAYCRIIGEKLVIDGFTGNEATLDIHRNQVTTNPDDYEFAGKTLAQSFPEFGNIDK